MNKIKMRKKGRSGSWDIGFQASLQPAAVQAHKEQTDSMIDHFGWIHCWDTAHGVYSIVSVLLIKYIQYLQ